MLMLDLRTCVLAAGLFLVTGAFGGAVLWHRLSSNSDPEIASTERPGAEVPQPAEVDEGVEPVSHHEPETDARTVRAVPEYPFWQGLGVWLGGLLIAPFAFRHPIRTALRRQSNYDNASIAGIWLVVAIGSAWFLWGETLAPHGGVVSVITAAILSLLWLGLFCSQVAVWLDE